jgi:hypothetical protein
MVFQVIVPKQIRAFEIGRHRLQFIYQAAAAFEKVNAAKWLGQIKSEAGYANVAGIELALLDCARYFHKSAGIGGVAQIAKDIGANADPRKLVQAAAYYENSSVRRLGYLLELAGHDRQSKALKSFVGKPKSLKPLDLSVTALSDSLLATSEKNFKWMLVINVPVEIDS